LNNDIWNNQLYPAEMAMRIPKRILTGFQKAILIPKVIPILTVIPMGSPKGFLMAIQKVIPTEILKPTVTH